MVPMRAQKRKEAFHEPRKSLEMNKTIGIGSWPRFRSEFWRCPLPMNHPLSRRAATLSPPCGERAGRVVPIWFMAPIRVQILEIPPLHEPPGFMAPARACKIVGTTHEPESRPLFGNPGPVVLEPPALLVPV